MSEQKCFQHIIDYGRSFVLWIWKVIKKLLWMLGFLPWVLDLAYAYIPGQCIPKPVQMLLEKGGRWQLTAILGGFGLLLSVYGVYRETERDLEQCRSDLRELKDKRPDIAVGFRDEGGYLVQTLGLKLEPLPKLDLGDLDAHVEEKRQRLIARQEESLSSPSFYSHLFQDPNPYYEAELGRYLVEFREWLLKVYRHYTGAVYCIFPILENRGNCTVSNIVLEFVMPPAYEKPSQDLDPRRAEELEKQGFTPEEIQDKLLPEPQEPRVFVSTLVSNSSVLQNVFRNQVASDTEGPRYEMKEDRWHIAYSVTSLIQDRTKDDLEPFLVWLGEIRETTVWEITARVDVGEPPLNLEQVLEIDIDVQVPSSA